MLNVRYCTFDVLSELFPKYLFYILDLCYYYYLWYISVDLLNSSIFDVKTNNKSH